MSNIREKILIIRLGAIGDVIHSTILAQTIKISHPNVEIHFLTAKFIAPLLRNNPNIDKVLEFNMKEKSNYLYLLYLGLKLRQEKYDVIFPLSNSIRNYILTFVANPKRKQKRNKHRIHAVDAFYNTACDAYGEMQKPQNLEIYIKEELKQTIKEKFNNLPKPFIILSPGGANDMDRQGRIWADEYWIELGNTLNEKYGATIFVCGSDKEKENHQQYKTINNSVILSGELTLEESAALFSVSDLFISGDSGPLHLASALNINTIGLMGSTPKSACSPYGDKGFALEPNIDCKYCEQKVCKILKEGEKTTPCMKSIKVCDILNLIEKEALL